MKNHFNEDENYLAGAKFSTDYLSFSGVIDQVFEAEHGVKTRKEIAALVGVTASQVTHWASNPRKITPESIRKLLEPISHPYLREHIVRAWLASSLDEDFIGGRDATLLSNPGSDDECLKQIDRYIQQGRLGSAESLATHLLESTKSLEMYELALDKLLYLRTMLDAPGRAAEVCRIITGRARERGELSRELFGQMQWIHLLVLGPKLSAKHVLGLYSEVMKRFVEQAQEPKPAYQVATLLSLKIGKLGLVAKLARSGKVSPSALAPFLDEAASEAKKNPTGPAQSIFYKLASELAVELEEWSLAERYLKNSHIGVGEVPSPEHQLIQSRILLGNGNADDAEDTCRSAMAQFRSQGDIKALREANLVLLDVESRKFSKMP